MSKPTTLYDKIWNDHLVHEAEDGTCLLYIDRHLVHEVTSPQAFEGLRATGRKVHAPGEDAGRRRPQHPDHRSLQAESGPREHRADRVLEANAKEFGIEYFNEFDKRQGIVHVIGPEQGFTLPGTTIVCGDSHTSTHGAFGALAHGIGTSEVEHVLATQTLIQKKAKNMRVSSSTANCRRRHRQGHHPGHHRRDRHRRRHRLRAGICRRGDPRALDGRPHDGLQHVDRRRRPRRPVAPDQKAFDFLRGRPKAPKGADLGCAMRYWEHACAPTRARISTVRAAARRRQAAADRDLGHEP